MRRVFEELLGVSFPKKRPAFLQGLELDGYNERLRLAFEYNGEQHYKVVPRFHKGGFADLEAQQANDALKAELCDDEWVTLISIPYRVRNLRAFVRRSLCELGYTLLGEERDVGDRV